MKLKKYYGTHFKVQVLVVISTDMVKTALVSGCKYSQLQLAELAQLYGQWSTTVVLALYVAD